MVNKKRWRAGHRLGPRPMVLKGPRATTHSRNVPAKSFYFFSPHWNLVFGSDGFTSTWPHFIFFSPVAGG